MKLRHSTKRQGESGRTRRQLQGQTVFQVTALPEPGLNVPLWQLAALLHQDHRVQKLCVPSNGHVTTHMLIHQLQSAGGTFT